MKYHQFFALSLLVLLLGCAGIEPLPVKRSGGPYYEEIKSPVPRDTLLYGNDCFPR